MNFVLCVCFFWPGFRSFGEAPARWIETEVWVTPLLMKTSCNLQSSPPTHRPSNWIHSLSLQPGKLQSKVKIVQSPCRRWSRTAGWHITRDIHIPTIHGFQAEKTAMVSEKKRGQCEKGHYHMGEKTRFVAGIGSWIWLARWVSFLSKNPSSCNKSAMVSRFSWLLVAKTISFLPKPRCLQDFVDICQPYRTSSENETYSTYQKWHEILRWRRCSSSCPCCSAECLVCCTEGVVWGLDQPFFFQNGRKTRQII